MPMPTPELPTDADERALRPVPRSYFVAVFAAGGLVAVLLAFWFYRLEQAQPAPAAPEAAATQSGGALDESVQRELDALDEDDGPGWLAPAD